MSKYCDLKETGRVISQYFCSADNPAQNISSQVISR